MGGNYEFFFECFVWCLLNLTCYPYGHFSVTTGEYDNAAVSVILVCN